MTWQTKAWRTPSARQERIENKNNAMSEWCFQCGVAQRPQRAVGWDEDGEPACSGHAKRAANPLKLDRPAEVQVAETPVSVHSYPGQFVNEEEVEEAAAPSPVQTSAKEIVMREAPKYSERDCTDCGAQFVPNGARGERCVECAGKRKAKRAKKYRKNAKGSPCLDILTATPENCPELMPYPERGEATTTRSDEVHVTLTIPQAERLIKALLS